MSDNKLPMPIIYVKTGTVTVKEKRRAEKLGGILIIESTDPTSIRFLEPPIRASVADQQYAAMTVLHRIMDSVSPDLKRGDITKWFVEAIINHPKPQKVEPVKKVPS